jgi:hypothetical protein
MDTPEQSKLDQATSRRLARLSTMPVDTSRLERRLSEHLAGKKPARRPLLSFSRWRPAVGIAAAVLIAVLIGVMSLTGPTAMASPMELHRVHQGVVSGSLPAFNASDFPTARAELASLIEGAPRPAGDYPQSLRCCCGQELRGEQMAFIKLRHNDTPITIIMMQGHHVCAGTGETITDESRRRFIVHHENNGVQATLTSQGDHWICVMGAISTDELLSLARQLAI